MTMQFEATRTAFKFMGSGVSEGQMVLLSRHGDDPWEVDNITGPRPDFLAELQMIINKDVSASQIITDLEDNDSDDGDAQDDLIYDMEPDRDDPEVQDLIDLLDGAGLGDILLETEKDGHEDMNFNLIDFDSDLAKIEPPLTDPEVLSSIMEGLQGLKFTSIVAEDGHDSLEVVDDGDRFLWSEDIEKEFPSIRGGHGQLKTSGDSSDDSDGDLQIGDSLFTPKKPLSYKFISPPGEVPATPESPLFQFSTSAGTTHTPIKQPKFMDTKDMDSAEEMSEMETDSDEEMSVKEDEELSFSPVKRILPQTSKERYFKSSPSSDKQSSLVETSTLKQLGLVYNVPYDFIMCKTCETGVTLENVTLHCSKEVVRLPVWNDLKNGYEVKPSTPHLKPVSSSAKTEAAILNELKALLGYQPNPVRARDNKITGRQSQEEFLEQVKPHEDQVGPIEGLKVFEHGYVCVTGDCKDSEFPHCCLSRASMVKHLSKHGVKKKRGGPDDRFLEDVNLQTFLVSIGNWCYFQVPKGGAGLSKEPDLKTAQSGTEVSIEELLQMEQNEFLGTTMDVQGVFEDLIHPAFHDAGMVEFWKDTEISEFCKLLSIKPVQRNRARGETKLLINAIVATFMEICSHVKKAHPGVLHLIAKGALLYDLPQRRPFTVSTKKTTLAQYVLHEIQLLRWMIYGVSHSLHTKNGQPLLVFDEKQKSSLHNLIAALKKPEDAKKLGFLVIAALHNLYFPDYPDRAAFNVFSSPIAVYMAVRCITEEGAPIPLRDIPVLLARVQFSFRLRAFHYLYNDNSFRMLTVDIQQQADSQVSNSGQATTYSSTTLNEPLQRNTVQTTVKHHSSNTSNSNDEDEYNLSSSSSSDEDDNSGDLMELNAASPIGAMNMPPVQGISGGTWFRSAFKWCKTNLTEMNIAPYSTIRSWMKLFSHAQRNSRKAPNMQWISDEILRMDDKEFNFTNFKSFIHLQLDQLEIFIKDQVLLGHTLEELNIICDFAALNETGNIETLGYGTLFSNLTNEDSNKFICKAIEDGKLLSAANNTLDWDSTQTEIWMGCNHHAILHLCVLCHILQGAPGRLSEELKMQINNTTTGRRHLFCDPTLKTAVIWSNYWKGVKVTGRFKEVLRVLPYRIARLLFIMIRVVRPVECMYLIKCKIKSEDVSQLKSVYRNCLWASLGKVPTEASMYSAFAAFFRRRDADDEKPFAWITGVQDYRHIAVAIQRRHLPGKTRYSRVIAEAQTSIGDLQAGRTEATSQQYYAIEKTCIPTDPGFIHHYVSYSKEWHSLFELYTSPGQEDKYQV